MDLPSLGRSVHLRVQVHRFRCATTTCSRRIFGEPLADSVAPRSARRTAKARGHRSSSRDRIGRLSRAALARRLMLPVSRDSLLPVLWRRAQAPEVGPSASSASTISPGSEGSDRKRRCAIWSGAGSSICCGTESPSQWRRGWHPIARSPWCPGPWRRVWPRGVEGRATGDPGRRPLAPNGECQRRVFQRRASIDGDHPPSALFHRHRPALPTFAERVQYDGFRRRQDSSQAIKAPTSPRKSIKVITGSASRGRKLVRSVPRGGDGDVFRCRIRMLEPHTPKLRAEWEASLRNGAEPWRRVCNRV